MTKTAATVALILGLLLPACGAEEAEPPEASRPTQTEEPLASPTEQAVAATATVPPSCEDAAGDSTGALDLTSVTIAKTTEEVLFIYNYEGSLPASGSVLFATLSGTKQYGYKIVDGQESAHFIFDFSASQQSNVDAEASVGPGEARFAIPIDEVDVGSLAGGIATINLDGNDVDECELA